MTTKFREGHTTLDLSDNTALTELICDRNQLTTLDLSKNLKLDIVRILRNPLEKLFLYKYNTIRDVYLSDIESEYGDIIEYVE